MESCNFSIDDDFMKQLEKLENADDVAEKILTGIAPIIVKKEKSRLKSVVRANGKSTGEMINSIKATNVKKNEWGHYIVIRPTGKDKKGVRNMEKFIYHEYGTSTQKATPIQTTVVKETEPEVIEKAQEIFNKEMGL